MDEAARRKLVDDVTKRLADSGKLIEAGWMAMRMLSVPEDAPAVQLSAMRHAFYGGAQHLWGSIMSFLDPGVEPTEADMRRMDAINDELQEFIASIEAEAGGAPRG